MNGVRLADIPGCQRGDASETSGSDEDTVVVGDKGPEEEESTPVFEVEWRDSLYDPFVHGPRGGSVTILASGEVEGGKSCGMNESADVRPGRHEWRIRWRESKEGCFTAVERALAKRARPSHRPGRGKLESGFLGLSRGWNYWAGFAGAISCRAAIRGL